MNDDLSKAAQAMGKRSAKVRLEKYGMEQYQKLGQLSAKKRMFKKRANSTNKKP